MRGRTTACRWSRRLAWGRGMSSAERTEQLVPRRVPSWAVLSAARRSAGCEFVRQWAEPCDCRCLLRFAQAHFVAWVKHRRRARPRVVLIESVRALPHPRASRSDRDERSRRGMGGDTCGDPGPMLVRPSSGGWLVGTVSPDRRCCVRTLQPLRDRTFVWPRRCEPRHRDSWTYGLVRHPIYLGYVIANAGYLLWRPTGMNSAISSSSRRERNCVRISCEEDPYPRFRIRRISQSRFATG